VVKPEVLESLREVLEERAELVAQLRRLTPDRRSNPAVSVRAPAAGQCGARQEDDDSNRPDLSRRSARLFHAESDGECEEKQHRAGHKEGDRQRPPRAVLLHAGGNVIPHDVGTVTEGWPRVDEDVPNPVGRGTLVDRLRIGPG
jgi:hypothetical protein